MRVEYDDEGSNGNSSSDSDSGSGGDESNGDDPSDNNPSDNNDSNVPTDSSDAERNNRATGNSDSSNQPDRATGSDSSNRFGLLGDRTEKQRFHLTEGFNNSPTDRGFSLGVDKGDRTSPGERSSGWSGLDGLDKPKDSTGNIVLDFAEGVKDFWKNYQEMKAQNVIGADRYYHCMANCEASQRGSGGQIAADIISSGREFVDRPKNITRGMTWADSTADCEGDMRANRIGQEAGTKGVRCYDACNQFRPKGLK
jgi:Serum amyloid A protein